jgi:uncharacterized cupin superfamily protein
MSINLLRADDIKAMPEIVTHHQFNDNAVRHSKSLTANTGMQRIGIHLVRIESGRDSTTHHFHDADEEFIYILSGHGIAKIDDTEFSVGPGDFMGFSAPSAAHSLHNPNLEDLVYLMGGERWATDVVHYPDIKRTMIKSHGKRRWAAWDDFEELPPRP